MVALLLVIIIFKLLGVFTVRHPIKHCLILCAYKIIRTIFASYDFIVCITFNCSSRNPIFWPHSEAIESSLQSTSISTLQRWPIWCGSLILANFKGARFRLAHSRKTAQHETRYTDWKMSTVVLNSTNNLLSGTTWRFF